MENRIIPCSQKIPLLNKSRLKFAEVVFCTSMQQLRYIFFLLTVYFIENSMIFFKGKLTFFETSLKNNKISIFFNCGLSANCSCYNHACHLLCRGFVRRPRVMDVVFERCGSCCQKWLVKCNMVFAVGSV